MAASMFSHMISCNPMYGDHASCLSMYIDSQVSHTTKGSSAVCAHKPTTTAVSKNSNKQQSTMDEDDEISDQVFNEISC